MNRAEKILEERVVAQKMSKVIKHIQALKREGEKDKEIFRLVSQMKSGLSDKALKAMIKITKKFPAKG